MCTGAGDVCGAVKCIELARLVFFTLVLSISVSTVCD